MNRSLILLPLFLFCKFGENNLFPLRKNISRPEVVSGAIFSNDGVCFWSLKVVFEFLSDPSPSVLEIVFEILSPFGPPKKRINFDVLKKHAFFVY